MAHVTGSGPEIADRSELDLRADLLAEVDAAVERLLSAASSAPGDALVGGTWTVHDVVGHVTF